MKLSINEDILNVICDIKRAYNNCQTANTDLYQVINKPFSVFKVKHLLRDKEKISHLCKAAHSVELLEKNNDLYKLKQSGPLDKASDPIISSFLNLLSNDLKPLLECIVGYSFNSTLSATVSLYSQGDVLLCHDDRCEDRCLAFVYYLNDVPSGAGGSFDMFQHDETGQPTEVVLSIPPEADSLVCFEVGNYTYHQVSEMTMDGEERLSINGWFHSEKALNIEPLNYRDSLPPLQHQSILQGLLMLDDFVCTGRCTPSYMDQVRKVFAEESHILLPDFFTKTFHNLIEESLRNPSIVWHQRGPSNRRQYEVVDLKKVKGPLGTLINFIKSSLFVSYLKGISGLSLEPLTGEAGGSCTEMIIEIQRWTPGCYSMATDNDCFFDHDGLDLLLYFNVADKMESEGQESGGWVTYLDATGSPGDPDNELLTVVPTRNSLCAVYRTSDTVRFTKYLSRACSDGSKDCAYHCIAVTYYEAGHSFTPRHNQPTPNHL